MIRLPGRCQWMPVERRAQRRSPSSFAHQEGEFQHAAFGAKGEPGCDFRAAVGGAWMVPILIWFLGCLDSGRG